MGHALTYMPQPKDDVEKPPLVFIHFEFNSKSLHVFLFCVIL